ncbi:MAG: 4-hydroxy-tetrahydrodipicolinate reductase [Bryobacteraceae bacterium]
MNRLAIVGYGKMGRLVDQLAPQHGFETVLRLDEHNNAEGSGITADAFAGVDAAVEFSTPEIAPQNLKRLAQAGVRTVTGTTGWLAALPEVAGAFERAGVGLVWSPNFSVGVAVFRRIVALAAELLRGQDDYGAWAWEIHHGEKKDAPSGTLLHLVRTMEEHGYSKKIDVGSNRAGRHPGTHEIGFDSAADTITLRHTARSREGFAHGALQAARWIMDHTGVYTFEEVLFGPDSRV